MKIVYFNEKYFSSDFLKLNVFNRYQINTIDAASPVNVAIISWIGTAILSVGSGNNPPATLYIMTDVNKIKYLFLAISDGLDR